MKPPRRLPSFVQALTSNVAGLVIALGLALLIAMVWQGIATTEEASRREIDETLDRAAERLQILVRAAEMTAESAERALRATEVTGAALRSTLETSLAAFEQRPELSYLGVVLPETGEYGCLERTATGAIWLWLFPGTRTHDPVMRNFVLSDKGFVLREERPTDGYDPRSRPFYLAALHSPADDTWIPTYRWIVHTGDSDPLWGFSYVKALRDDTGRLICVLDTDLDMPALNSFLRSIAAEYRCGLQVVELGETPRLIGDSKVGRAPLPLPDQLAPLIGLSDGAFVDRMELEGERRWVAARRLALKGGVSWLVVASRKDPFIAAPLRRQLYQVVGMGLATAAGLVVVSARMARRFGQPLAELEQRVAGFGQREPAAPALPAASVASGFRETQHLSEAFGRMAVAVRQRERELSEQNYRFHAAARATGDVIWDWDLTTNAIWWNENYKILFGYSAEEIEPTIESWTSRLHPEDRERGVAHIQAIIDGSEETWVDEYRFRRQDGTYADLFDRGHVLRDASGRGVRMVGAIQDITERKQAQARLLAFNAELEQRVAQRTQELETLNKELESFSYSVSHDLRAPLRAIAGFAEILAKNHAAVLDDTAKNYFGRILAATQRMGELIDDLLKLSRVSREEMHRETVNLSAMAREVLAHLQQSAPERRVEIAVEEGLTAVGDARLLRIVLENLLGNAWKFTAKTPDARIAFSASNEDGTPAFAVSDNGAGFDMRYAHKLFGAFQRLHRTTEFPGTGIGLATVQRIVHRHGGRISVQARPQEGATFRFSIPTAP